MTNQDASATDLGEATPDPRGTCPFCGSGEVFHIHFGLPIDADSLPAWVRLGGCVIPNGEVVRDRYCDDCGRGWAAEVPTIEPRNQFLSDSLWPTCAELAKGSDRTRAAIAYAGKQAHKLLPLGSGDQIVIDASKANLLAGATSPEGISNWLDAGATVYSIEGLHAKVLRFSGAEGEVTVVGSGNASAHSRDDLIEAAILSRDGTTRQLVDEFIDKLIAQAGAPLDESWVESARKIYRTPRFPGPKRKRIPVFPFAHRQLWVSSWLVDPEWPVSKGTESAARAAELDFDGRVSTWAWGLHGGDELNVRAGDGVLLYETRGGKDFDGRWTASAGRIVKVISGQGGPPDAIVAFDADVPVRRLKQIRSVYEAHGVEWDPDEPVPAGTALHAGLLALWGSSTRSKQGGGLGDAPHCYSSYRHHRTFQRERNRVRMHAVPPPP